MIWAAGETINRIVQRDIDIAERGTIATLNDLPDWMVEEARTIARESPVCAIRYLRFYIARDHSPWVEDFVEEVIFKRQEAKTWNIRDCLCIPREPTQTTALEIDYTGSLQKIEGEGWFRVRPINITHKSDYIAGIVGIMLRNTKYWHSQTMPSDLDCYMFNPPEDIEPVDADQVDSSIRRWIAHRLAWWAKSYLEQAGPSAVGHEIIRAVPDVDMSRVTRDAEIAAQALAREAQAFAHSSDFLQQAGFLGPNEWYQSSPRTAHTQPG